MVISNHANSKLMRKVSNSQKIPNMNDKGDFDPPDTDHKAPATGAGPGTSQ